MRKLTCFAMTLTLLAAWSLGGKAGHAAVFHWVDEDGVHHYSNRPGNPDSERMDIWSDGDGSLPTVIDLDPNYNQIIHEACAYYKVDPNLIKAMMKCESNFNRYAVSHAGAQGLMQLMPGTARRFKVNDPFHPVENIWAGVYYVKYLMVLFDNNMDWVIAGYNAGEGAVKKYGGIPPYRETKGYVKKVNYYWKLYNKKEPKWKKPTATAQQTKKK